MYLNIKISKVLFLKQNARNSKNCINTNSVTHEKNYKYLFIILFRIYIPKDLICSARNVMYALIISKKNVYYFN